MRLQAMAMTTIRTTDTRLQAMATMAAKTDMVAMVAMANPTDMEMLHNTTEPGTMPQPMRVKESTLPQIMVMKTPFTELTTNKPLLDTQNSHARSQLETSTSRCWTPRIPMRDLNW